MDKLPQKKAKYKVKAACIYLCRTYSHVELASAFEPILNSEYTDPQTKYTTGNFPMTLVES